MQDFKNLATEIVAEFKKQGVDACDVYIVNGSQFNTTIRLGQIERLQQSISKGLGMRIFKNDATALTYTTDFTDKSVKNLVKEAMEIVKVSGADKFNGLAPREFLGNYGGNLMLFDESLARLSPEKKIETAKAAEEAGRSFDKRITNTRGTNWFDGTFQQTLANSDGFVGQYKSTTASLNVTLMAEENGIKQTDGWFTFSRFVNKLDPARAVGEEADICSVGVVVAARQPDRLRRRVAVLHRAMRQEPFLAVRPQMGVERIPTLLGAKLHHRPPFPLQALFQKPGQHLLQRLVLQVIEQYLGHRGGQPS